MGGRENSVGVGDVLGDFRVIRKLGEGGMGVVYLAEDERLERKVALKVIAPHLARDKDFRKRFISEAKSAAAIDHPNAVTVYSTGTIDDNLYIAMRYVEGTDLRERLKESGALDPESATTVLAEVAAALDAAHAAGLVHRDVKPGNILIAGEPGTGEAYLTDFGLTKGGEDAGIQLTGTGQWVGTIDYVAPEQIRAGTIDARSDVYALGCVLYEMLTGSVPYDGNEMQKMWGHVNEPFPGIGESESEAGAQIGAVLERATAKDPDDRFPSAGDLARAASAAAHGEVVAVEEASVATGAAAAGMSEQAETKKLPKPNAKPAPGMAPTVAGRPALRPPPPPPPPPPPQPRKAGGGGWDSSASRTAAIIGGAVVIAAGLLAAAVVIAGNDSGGGSGEVGSAPITSRETDPKGNGKTERAPPKPKLDLPPDAGPCARGVWVRSGTTSCEFGLEVAQAFRRAGSRPGTVEAFSPVTGITYSMSCAGANPVICTGGNEAAVYLATVGAT